MPNARALVTAPLACLALALAVALAGCGGDDSSSAGAKTGTQAATAPATQAAKPPLAQQDITKDLETKLSIAPGQGKPPTTLLQKDIVVGKGRAAKDGDNVSVQYVGNSWSTGAQFDASWDRGQPFEFKLGAGNVIAGWDKGVKGMKPGGRRLLIIPPDQAYGPQGSPPAIGPDETLIFVIDLEKATSGK